MRIACVCPLLIGAAGAAHAAEVDATFVAPTFELGNTPVTGGTVHENQDGTFTLVGTAGGSSVGWELDWNFTIDYDPSINGSLTLTNFSNSVHDYKLMLDLPVSAFGPSSLYGGSLTATLFDDGDANAALGLSSAPGASPSIYNGTIDGVTVLHLFSPFGCF